MRVKFSFVIPTLNEGLLIKKCLGSIKKQARKDYEIIVVDSYSKDTTVKIAKKHNARVLYEKRKGPGVARNTGAKRARGEILIFADADVVFPRDFLDMVEKRFSRNIAGGICRLVPYDSHAQSILLNYKFANSIARLFLSMGIIITVGSCFVYRKNIFKKTGGFDTRFLTNEDHELAKRVSRLGRIQFFKEINIGTSTRRVNKWGIIKSYRIYVKSTLLYWMNHGYVRNYWQ